MSLEDRINSIANSTFQKTDEPYDYRYGLVDDQFDPSAFCCEVERIYGHDAESVYKVLKGSILDTPLDYINMQKEIPIQDIIDIQDAIIKLDNFIDIKKHYMKKNTDGVTK